MAVNPMALLKLKDRFRIFNEEHPKARPFFHTLRTSAVREGSIIEIKVTDPDGKEYVSNIRVTPNDVETIGILTDLGHR